MVEKRMREVLAVEKAKQAPQPRMQPPREDQANPAHRAKAEEKMEAEVPAKAADVKVQEINARDADALKSRNWGSFKIGNGRLRAAMKEFGKEKVLNPLIDMKEGFKQTFKPSDNEDLPTPQPSLNPGIAQPVKPADPHGAGMAMEELMKSLSEDPQNGANPPPHNIQNQQHQRLSNLQAPPGAAGSGGAGGQLWPGPESFPAPARNLNQGQLQSIRQFLVLAHSAVPVARQAEEFAASGALVRRRDGEFYRGQVVRGEEAEGLGVSLLPSGTRLAGTFKANKLNGLGSKEGADKSRYIGYFVNGEYSGAGRLWSGDGTEFCGQFLHGCYHGWGCLINPDRSYVIGNFSMGAAVGSEAPSAPRPPLRTFVT
eukprot:CAMPEP_0184315048 /NCGR_PEP_ID=MMETSP1049-20130417/79672_1 /TAXON_ID=77928 /ORGANISM="Proteomonas sulcata, Strain CCMP704" /LENGTH=370 /DNA_ID=CAMNT_0026633317 /DNA_START=3 /DNA_END=1115 /DNA_ORIENTATION=-